MFMKRLLRTATHSGLFSHAVTLLEARGAPSDLLRILTYHRVDHPERVPFLSPELNSATPEGFDEQMRYVAEHYQPVSPQDLLDFFDHQRPLPPRAVMVTFDDAYRDFAEHAWPVLKRYNIPVALFVATDYPDQPKRSFWWDRLYSALGQTRVQAVETPFQPSLPLATPAQRTRAFRLLRNYVKTLPHEQALLWVDEFCARLGVVDAGRNHVLSWDELRALAADGVTLGAHTRSHPMLNRVSLQTVRHEVAGSLNDLRRQIGRALPIFAYPGGGLSDDVVNVLKDEGFALAFTTVRGLNALPTADRLRLKRINVGRLAPLAVVRAQLAGLTLQVA